MKDIAYQVWCSVALCGVFIMYAVYVIWHWITGQPVQPIN